MNTTRPIDDTLLSAYLDGELSGEELREVRAALATDARLAERLAVLQRVNELVVQHAAALDARPLPAGVLDMLREDGATSAVPGNVVQGPWHRWSPRAGAQLALAASLVLALGLVLNAVLDPAPTEVPALAAYVQQLEVLPSGVAAAVDGATLSTRFSFVDRSGRYCRQYQLNASAAGTENIACRTEQGWMLVASLPVPVQATELYQPAGASAELNALLDSMMAGTALDLAAERNLIDKGWQEE